MGGLKLMALQGCVHLRQGGWAFAPSFLCEGGLTLGNSRAPSASTPPCSWGGERAVGSIHHRASASSLTVPSSQCVIPSCPGQSVLLPVFPQLLCIQELLKGRAALCTSLAQTFTWCQGVARRKWNVLSEREVSASDYDFTSLGFPL